MGLSDLTAVFGWMLVINLVIYTWAALWIIFARDWVSNMQARIMGVRAEDWTGYYIDYLSRYKLMLIVFNLAPYLALRIVGAG